MAVRQISHDRQVTASDRHRWLVPVLLAAPVPWIGHPTVSAGWLALNLVWLSVVLGATTRVVSAKAVHVASIALATVTAGAGAIAFLSPVNSLRLVGYVGVLGVVAVVSRSSSARRSEVAHVLGMSSCLYLAAIGVSSELGFDPFDIARSERNWALPTLGAKTQLVPRPYGEAAILVSAAVAFGFGAARRTSARAVAGAAIALGCLGLQSRAAWLSAAATSALLFSPSLVLQRLAKAPRIAAFAPIAASVLASYVVDLGEVGEGTGLDDNLVIRQNLTQLAAERILSSPLRHFAGASQSDFQAEIDAAGFVEGVLHNHFVAVSWMLGLTGGLLVLLVFYVLPVGRLLRCATGDPLAKQKAAFGFGCLIALSTFEGLLSATLLLALLLLNAGAEPDG